MSVRKGLNKDGSRETTGDRSRRPLWVTDKDFRSIFHSGNDRMNATVVLNRIMM